MIVLGLLSWRYRVCHVMCLSDCLCICLSVGPGAGQVRRQVPELSAAGPVARGAAAAEGAGESALARRGAQILTGRWEGGWC